MIPDQGWIEYVEWTNNTGDPILYFAGTWIVPPEPTAKDDQSIYLYTALQQSSSGPDILQPVLQWTPSGIGNGPCWTITNWYVGGSGAAVTPKAPPVQVSPGDSIQGVIICTGQSGKLFSYRSSFVGFPSLDLVVTDVEELGWACITLECYGALRSLTLTQCQDYPNNTGVTFSPIEIQTGPLGAPTDVKIQWQEVVKFTSCQQRCAIQNNGSSNTVVTLAYQNSP